MVHHGPADPGAPKRTAPPRDYVPPIPPAEELPERYILLFHQVARFKDEYDRAEYYRQLHGKRIDALEAELHELRAALWRRDEELMGLRRGQDWNAAANLVRRHTEMLLADPKCNRRMLQRGLDEIIESIRVRGLRQ